jgi:hypothetical protein
MGLDEERSIVLTTGSLAGVREPHLALRRCNS